MDPKIFISYRKSDGTSTSLWLCDKLKAIFGDANVFRDDTLVAGWDYRAELTSKLEVSTVLLAIIGKDWLGAENPDTKTRRLDDPDDWVRVEIGKALQRHIQTIPVLVDEAPMPSKDRLPKELIDLSYQQACRIDQ